MQAETPTHKIKENLGLVVGTLVIPNTARQAGGSNVEGYLSFGLYREIEISLTYQDPQKQKAPPYTNKTKQTKERKTIKNPAHVQG